MLSIRFSWVNAIDVLETLQDLYSLIVEMSDPRLYRGQCLLKRTRNSKKYAKTP